MIDCDFSLVEQYVVSNGAIMELPLRRTLVLQQFY